MEESVKIAACHYRARAFALIDEMICLMADLSKWV
jgi:hypothetical protein